MKDIKVKPPMDKPKVLEKVNVLPREVGTIMKGRYISKKFSQKVENSTATNAASNDAIQGIEINTKNALSYTTQKGIKHLKKGRTQINQIRKGANADPKLQVSNQNGTQTNLKNALPQKGEAFFRYEGSDTANQTAQAKQKFQHDCIKQRHENTRLQHKAEKQNNTNLQNDNAISVSEKQHKTLVKNINVKKRPTRMLALKIP